MVGTNLYGLLSNLRHHLDWTKLIGGVDDSRTIANLQYRGEYFEKNVVRVQEALTKIEEIANEMGYADIQKVLSEKYEDGWKVEDIS